MTELAEWSTTYIAVLVSGLGFISQCTANRTYYFEIGIDTDSWLCPDQSSLCPNVQGSAINAQQASYCTTIFIFFIDLPDARCVLFERVWEKVDIPGKKAGSRRTRQRLRRALCRDVLHLSRNTLLSGGLV